MRRILLAACALLGIFWVARPQSTVVGQLPVLVANYSITGLTSASGPTTAYTTTAAGDYLVCVNAWITTAGTGGTMTVYYSATAVATAMPFVLQMNPVNGSLTGGGQTSGCVIVQAANATAIQYQTGFNSATGSPAYSLDVTVQRVK